MDEKTATIVVFPWYSSCSRCRRNTLVTGVQLHGRISGYGGGDPGCGARFTAITSGTIGPLDVRALAAMRPDLPIVDPVTGDVVQEAQAASGDTAEGDAPRGGDQ